MAASVNINEVYLVRVADPEVVVNHINSLAIDLLATRIKGADAAKTALDITGTLIVSLTQSDLVPAGVAVVVLLAAVRRDLVLRAGSPAVERREAPVVGILADHVGTAVLVRRDVGVAVGGHVGLGVFVEDEGVGGEVAVGRDAAGEALWDHAGVVLLTGVGVIYGLEVVGGRGGPRVDLLVRDGFHCVLQACRAGDGRQFVGLGKGLGVVEHDGVVVEGDGNVGARVDCELVEFVLLDTVCKDANVLVTVGTLVLVGESDEMSKLKFWHESQYTVKMIWYIFTSWEGVPASRQALCVPAERNFSQALG